MGCPVPKVCKTGAGAALLRDPDRAVALARAAAQGERAAGNRQAALGPAARATVRNRGRAAAGVRRSRRRDLRSIPATPPSATRASPTTRSRAQLVEELPVPVLVSGGLQTAAQARAAFEQTGAAAVLLARGSLGNPWLFEQLLGMRDRRSGARGDPRRARLGDGTRGRASRAPSAPPATCASSIRGTRAPGPGDTSIRSGAIRATQADACRRAPTLEACARHPATRLAAVTAAALTPARVGSRAVLRAGDSGGRERGCRAGGPGGRRAPRCSRTARTTTAASTTSCLPATNGLVNLVQLGQYETNKTYPPHNDDQLQMYST